MKVIYLRDINYYETDKMGIVHHANYLHYLEEARLHFLTVNQLSYFKLEQSGIYSPTTKIEISYKRPATYGDKIAVETSLTEVTPIRFVFTYKIIDEASKIIIAVARSEHCFSDKEGRLIVLKRFDKALADRLESLIETNEVYL